MSDYIKTEKVLDLLAGVTAEIIKMPPEEPEKPARDLIDKRTIDFILGRTDTHEKRTGTHACVSKRTEKHADLISRQAAIDALTHKWDGMVTSVFDVLKELPSAEPHWIPVSERLPEDNDPVIVTWVNHNPEVYYKDITDKPFTATAHYHNGHWYWYSSVTQAYLDEYGTWEPDLVDEDIGIIAWMPLPEPYREGEQG